MGQTMLFFFWARNWWMNESGIQTSCCPDHSKKLKRLQNNGSFGLDLKLLTLIITHIHFWIEFLREAHWCKLRSLHASSKQSKVYSLKHQATPTMTLEEVQVRHKKEIKAFDLEKRAQLKKAKATAGKGKKGKEVLTEWGISLLMTLFVITK